MIHDLLVSGVTVFPGREHFEFVPGINVVVGGNDSGKSHLLKLCYTVAKWSADGGRKSLPEKWAEEQRLRKDLMRVFASRGLALSVEGCPIQATFVSVSRTGLIRQA